MKRQTTKGNVATREQQGNRKRNTANRKVSSTGNRDMGLRASGWKLGKLKTALKVSLKEMEKLLRDKILKTNTKINSIHRKIEKLENERREIILKILEDRSAEGLRRESVNS